VSDIQTELKAALDTITENDFHDVFEAWKN
jgi:hypothetical protein